MDILKELLMANCWVERMVDMTAEVMADKMDDKRVELRAVG